MKGIYKNAPLLMGFALFSNMAFTQQVVPIHCPDPHSFDIKPQRTAQEGINFLFVARPGTVPAWSDISLHVNAAMPMGSSDKTNPVLHFVPPIMVSQDAYHDWTIVCKYQDDRKYGTALNVPVTHVTLKHEQFKTCKVRNATTVNCETVQPQ